MMVFIGVIGIAMAAIGIEFYNKDEDKKDLPKSNMTFLIILLSVFCILTLSILIYGGMQLKQGKLKLKLNPAEFMRVQQSGVKVDARFDCSQYDNDIDNCIKFGCRFTKDSKCVQGNKK